MSLFRAVQIQTLTVILLSLVSLHSHAKVTLEEANLLKSSLTPMGAVKEGNSNGTIPAYTGKILGAPHGFNLSASHQAEMYPNEKPLFIINKSNVNEHVKYLTEGQTALIKSYPNSFSMPVYPSHRDTRYSDRIHANVYKNATTAELSEIGSGLKNAHGGIPFPITQSGPEAIFNHLMSQDQWNVQVVRDSASVFSNGNMSLGTSQDTIYVPYYDPDIDADQFKSHDGIGAYILLKNTLPARHKGRMALIHEYPNKPRDSWVYLPGMRRVKRAPTIGYDTPLDDAGLITIDDYRLFNGSIDRFEWTLEGKREIFIPYNNGKFDDPKVKYKDLLPKYHANPDYMRYELHRVWVVKGRLKSEARHIYSARTLYIDEDSWTAVLADNYDGKGYLWKTNMRLLVNSFTMPGITGRASIYHNLQSKDYYVTALINEQNKPKTIPTARPKSNFFTPSSLRRVGNR